MSLEEIKDLLQKLQPVLGSKTRALWYSYILSKDHKALANSRKLLRLLADNRAKQSFFHDIKLPPPKVSKLPGKYRLGDVIYPTQKYGEFGLHEADFIKHILIAGMTGTGKTNLSFHLLKQLVQYKKPFLVFDWKRNYQALHQLPGFEDLKIIKLGSSDCRFRFNPLIPPPGIHPKHWLAMLVDVMKHSFFLGLGVEYFLRKGIDSLFERFGIYEGKEVFPTFSDLDKLLKKEYVKGREMLWMSSAKRVLASLTFSGLLGEVLNVRQQENIADLLKQKVIIEMDNLATIEKIFFVESLLLWIYHFRKLERIRETFKHAIIIEEAHHIFSGKKENEIGEEPIMETIIRMIREYGESVIVIDQEPSKVSNSILANTNSKICFNLGNGKDIEIMARAMSLNQEGKESIDKLKVGHAIIKLKSRFSEPLHVRFPLVDIDKKNRREIYRLK